MLTYHLGDEQKAVSGRSSETLSSPIDMIIIVEVDRLFRSAYRLRYHCPNNGGGTLL
jgi:hypothetical protein